MTWRFVPLVGLLLFYAVGFGWRTWLHARRYGSTGIVLFRSGRFGQHARETLFFVVALMLLGEAVLAALDPRALDALGGLPADVAAPLRPLGALLLAAGTALMAAAQLDLGASWRIGIDEGARPGLVTGGLYGFTRNPIFLAMLLAFAGFTLLLPTWLSFVTLLLTIAGIRRHVLDEEAYLGRTYGAAYRAYAGRVGRFLPAVGRLR